MTTLRAVADSALSNRYTVYANGAAVARIEGRTLRDAGTIRLGEREVSYRRRGLFRPTIVFEEHGALLARAEPANVLTSTWRVRTPQGDFRLVKPSWLRREYELHGEGGLVGRIRRQSWISRSAVVELQPDVPVELGLFALLVAQTAWSSEDAAASSGS
jgi:hypothetical protein